ncbi:fatty acid-binding protein, heart-like [Chrysoperla carnea]|uniref:fatty acid-binding protein, heart-like n=1 Tax=Chrysoperla carnea TaxID=189513 RepID=UPI001D098697|nr:fatty acid-binding protein, heart-like [Chrysoperla carnea]
MASAFAGNYEHEKDENMEQYYKALGLPDAEVEKYKKPWRTNVIEVNGDDVHVTTNAKISYKLGHDVDEILANGHKVKSHASLEGPKLVVRSTSPDGRKGTRTYELYDQGVLISLELEGSPVVGKIYYKRK